MTNKNSTCLSKRLGLASQADEFELLTAPQPQIKHTEELVHSFTF